MRVHEKLRIQESNILLQESNILEMTLFQTTHKWCLMRRGFEIKSLKIV